MSAIVYDPTEVNWAVARPSLRAAEIAAVDAAWRATAGRVDVGLPGPADRAGLIQHGQAVAAQVRAFATKAATGLAARGTAVAPAEISLIYTDEAGLQFLVIRGDGTIQTPVPDSIAQFARQAAGYAQTTHRAYSAA